MNTSLGSMSWNALCAVGITSQDALRASDPFEVYAALHRMRLTRSLSMLYRLIAAVEGSNWQDVAEMRRAEITHRLNQMGISSYPCARAHP